MQPDNFILKQELEKSKYDSLANKPEVLNELSAKALSGDKKAQELIINSITRLVWDDAETHFAKQEPAGVVPIEDYFQSGLEYSLRGFDQYDPTKIGFENRGTTLLTYLRNKAVGGMRDWYRNTRTTVMVPRNRKYIKKKDGTPDIDKANEGKILVNRINPFADDEQKASYSWLKGDYETPSESLERKDALFQIHSAMDKCGLTEIQKFSVYGTFRNLHEDIESLDHVAEMFGVSHEAVRKAGLKGIDKLRANKKVFSDLRQIFYT